MCMADASAQNTRVSGFYFFQLCSAVARTILVDGSSIEWPNANIMMLSSCLFKFHRGLPLDVAEAKIVVFVIDIVCMHVLAY